MVVVVVFLAGLGVGSLWMGRRIDRVASPARMFSGIELSLAAAGYLICYALGLDSSESIYYLQRAATSLGLPLRAVHASGSFLLLSVPCFLMGTTLPLASELCQREPALRRSRAVSQLYAVNTAGAVLGCLLGAAVLVPLWGQRVALLTAASANLASALIALLQLEPSRNLAWNPEPRLAAGIPDRWRRAENSGIRRARFRLRLLRPLVRNVPLPAIALRHGPCR